MAALERLDHRARRGRAADHHSLEGRQRRALGLEVIEQRQPHGRYPGGHRHLLVGEQLVDAGRVVGGSRQDQLGAGHRRRVRNAPAVGVKQRDDRQHRVGRRDAEGGRRGVGVQHRRSVVKQHALGVAGGPAGVAERARGPLVELGPPIARVARLDQLLVAQGVGQLRGHVRAVGHHDDVAERRPIPGELCDQRREGQVAKQRAVLGVVDDVGDLLGEQPRVDGVANSAHRRDAEIKLQVPVVVPRDRRDAVALADPQVGQRAGEPPRPGVELAVAVAVNRSLGGPRDDLALGVVARGEVEQRGDEQRAILHQAEHFESLRGWLQSIRRSSTPCRCGSPTPTPRATSTSPTT